MLQQHVRADWRSECNYLEDSHQGDCMKSWRMQILAAVSGDTQSSSAKKLQTATSESWRFKQLALSFFSLSLFFCEMCFLCEHAIYLMLTPQLPSATFFLFFFDNLKQARDHQVISTSLQGHPIACRNASYIYSMFTKKHMMIVHEIWKASDCHGEPQEHHCATQHAMVEKPLLQASHLVLLQWHHLTTCHFWMNWK